ncbi:dTMP kinase [Sinimarinibacterium thermocellulolyticum]|uniref:Thymidylate kinase n=1 Tax=Sinimarinibacterium thermocellulolyticum TaxID=3170016 RepID=A0ABV2AD17_9GAMM
MRGRFITLEGGEGSGKSTQARHVRDWLRARGREVVLTREPGGTPLAEAVRELVLRRWGEDVNAATELLLMFAARAAHVHGLIAPSLARGVDVVCDRFVDSSYAYQGARGIDAVHLRALEALAMPQIMPDLTLLLDLPPEQGLDRAQVRGDGNRFEAETLDYQRRVREIFLRRAAEDPARCVVIDASASVDRVSAAIDAVLQARL